MIEANTKENTVMNGSNSNNDGTKMDISNDSEGLIPREENENIVNIHKGDTSDSEELDVNVFNDSDTSNSSQRKDGLNFGSINDQMDFLETDGEPTTNTNNTIESSPFYALIRPPIGRSMSSFARMETRASRRMKNKNTITPKKPSTSNLASSSTSSSSSSSSLQKTTPHKDQGSSIGSSSTENTNHGTNRKKTQKAVPVIDRVTGISRLIDYLTEFINYTNPNGDNSAEIEFLKLYLNFMYDHDAENFPSPVPMWRSVPIDFYNMYRQVLSKGGYESLGDSLEEWNDVFEHTRSYNSMVGSGAPRTKILYAQYLLQFEIANKDNTELHNKVLAGINDISLDEFQRLSEDVQNRIIAKIKQTNLKESDVPVVNTPKTPKKSSSASEPPSESKKRTKKESVSTPQATEPKTKLTKTMLLNLQKDTTKAYLTFSSPTQKSVTFKVLIYHTPVGNAIMKNESSVSGPVESYGNLLYTNYENELDDENVRFELKNNITDTVEYGSLCYWEKGTSVLFGYGPTPKSKKEECRLTEKCVVFGKLSDDRYTFDSDLAVNGVLFLPSILSPWEEHHTESASLWTMKLSSTPPETQRDDPIPLKKRGVRGFDTSSGKRKLGYESSDSGKEHEEYKRILTLKYKYDNESDTDSRLVSQHITDTNVVDCKIVKDILKKDNVALDNISEIRYYKEGKDVNHTGWEIMKDNFIYTLTPSETVLRLKLTK